MTLKKKSRISALDIVLYAFMIIVLLAILLVKTAALLRGRKAKGTLKG